MALKIFVWFTIITAITVWCLLAAAFLMKVSDAIQAFFHNRKQRKQTEAKKAMQDACSKAMGDYYRSMEYMETKVEMRNFRIEGGRITEDRPTPNEYFRDMSVEEICENLEGRA